MMMMMTGAASTEPVNPLAALVASEVAATFVHAD